MRGPAYLAPHGPGNDLRRAADMFHGATFPRKRLENPLSPIMFIIPPTTKNATHEICYSTMYSR